MTDIKDTRTRTLRGAFKVLNAAEGLPTVIQLEACYLGWQQSLNNLAMLTEPEIDG